MKFALGFLLMFSGFLAAADIYLCGDSIMADYSARNPRPCYGWGEYVKNFCREEVRVFDRARPGAGTRTWLEQGLWQEMLTHVQKGDFVLIGLGLNDGDKKNTAVFCEPESFRKNLLKMVEDVKTKGATPLLLTSTEIYQAEAETVQRHARYNEQVRLAAAEAKVSCLDLYAAFAKRLEKETDSGKFYILKRTIPVKNWLDYDPVHLNEIGAQMVAAMVIDLIRKQPGSLESLLR